MRTGKQAGWLLMLLFLGVSSGVSSEAYAAGDNIFIFDKKNAAPAENEEQDAVSEDADDDRRGAEDQTEADGKPADADTPARPE